MKEPNQKSLIRLLLLVALAMLLFHAPFWLVAPFKWFEVFFHEYSHGLAALFTGGIIEKIDIQYIGSGTCYYRGGFKPAVTFSGYAGAALWGWIIYEVGHASQRKTSALLVALLLAILLISGALWVRDTQTATIMLLMGTLLALMLRFGGLSLMKFFVEFIGIFVLLASIQSPYFLFEDQGEGDGVALQNLTNISEHVWASLWILIGFSILLFLFLATLKKRP